MNRIVLIALLVAVVAAAPAGAKSITVTNKTNKAVTLSDFYTFTDTKNSQGKKEVLKKGDATDDVTLAANGGKKNITVDDNVKSVTISWLNANGKEVETDWNTNDFTIDEKNMAVFIAPAFAGKFAMACAAPTGNIPVDGANVNIVNGKISGGLYDWITFYDATGSNGDIARDVNGNPTSPLLNGVAMTVDFHYGIITPTSTPGVSPPALVAIVLGLMLLGALVLRRRRRFAVMS